MHVHWDAAFVNATHVLSVHLMRACMSSDTSFSGGGSLQSFCLCTQIHSAISEYEKKKRVPDFAFALF